MRVSFQGVYGPFGSIVRAMALGRHAHVGALTVSTVLASVAFCACGSDEPSSDAGTSNTGDAGPSDAGTSNTGDAGTGPDARGPVLPEKPLCKLAGPPKATAEDVQVWGDEFSGSAIDTARWNVFRAGERQGISLATFAAENVSLTNGLLNVTTTEGSTDPAYSYTTGRIDTAHHFARTYGRMDVRARFPIAPGVWYAVWARQWAQSFPEIDIEVLAKAVPEVWLVNHWAGKPLPPEERRKALKVPAIDPTVPHVYSVIWKPGVLEWRIDDVPAMQSEPDRGVPTSPIQWTINAWVGGWGGTPDGGTSFPTAFEVDYIRMYRQGGLIADPQIRITKFTRPGGAPYNVPPYHARTDALELEVANFDEACFHVEMREGDNVLAILDTPPFRFPLDVVPNGRHQFTFVATDGVREAVFDTVTTTY